jgi:hypothetical protein
MRASATRIFQPPESLPTSPSISSCAEAEAREDLARARLERVAAELLEARLHLAEALDQRVHLVDALGVGHRVLELAQLGGDALTGPAPSIVSATTALRPAISPTSWLK